MPNAPITPEAHDPGYTTRPTHLRIFTDGSEWFLDGADNALAFTEPCWSYETHADAVAAIPEFVECFTFDVSHARWAWDADRPREARQINPNL